jgi:hypothetical protein
MKRLISQTASFVLWVGAISLSNSLAPPSFSRRSFLTTSAASVLVTTIAAPLAIAANIPMVTTDEFSLILRDSARSVDHVEFAGPKSDRITVVLVDGTSFGLKDIIESSTDPRSPLKVAAICRENNIQTKFVDLEAILAKSPKRKKAYTNARVQEAAQKNKEKKERMANDEANRLAELQGR